MLKLASRNPVDAFPKPPFPEQAQPGTGSEQRMEPAPDYGEDTYVGNGRLTGKAALVTGGDSGIGRAVAVAFAKEGADVVIGYYQSEEDAVLTCSAVERTGRKAVAVGGDIGDPAFCNSFAHRALEELGHVEVLVNNAAWQQSHEGGLAETPVEEIERVFRTNILGVFFLTKALLPYLRPGASIINTTSIQAFEPKPHLIHYAATKGAISNFTMALSRELAPGGIRVNAVAPGPVWTPLIPASMTPDRVSHFGEQSPMRRPAQPVEVATAYVYLASDESSYVSGATIGVTGGTPTF
jgi:hypothetical protein